MPCPPRPSLVPCPPRPSQHRSPPRGHPTGPWTWRPARRGLRLRRSPARLRRRSRTRPLSPVRVARAGVGIGLRGVGGPVVLAPHGGTWAWPSSGRWRGLPGWGDRTCSPSRGWLVMRLQRRSRAWTRGRWVGRSATDATGEVQPRNMGLNFPSPGNGVPRDATCCTLHHHTGGGDAGSLQRVEHRGEIPPLSSTLRGPGGPGDRDAPEAPEPATPRSPAAPEAPDAP